MNNQRLASLLLCLLAAGCSKFGHASKEEGSSVPATSVASIGEPSEQDLRDFEFKRYEAIEAGGGLQLTVSGQSVIAHPKLYDVHKDKCTAVPQVAPSAFECELTISSSLSGRDEPREKGERVGVKRNANGEWVAW
jgi:hypothetical protein